MSHFWFSIDRPDLLGRPFEAALKGRMRAGTLWMPSTLGQGWLCATHGPDPASSAKAELQAQGSLNPQVWEHL